MPASVSEFRGRRGGSFGQIVAGFLGDEGLPFASVLSAERIMRVFAKHAGLFGFTGVYSTAMVLWSFLAQVLADGKGAACQAAVANVVAHCLQRGHEPPTSDTGDYCRARAKLSSIALRELNREIASELEDQAEEAWLWKGHHAKLVDGFTFTMPDTPQNQEQFPQNPVQKPGIGFPMARAVAVTSLATACVQDAAIGPYQGKQTGETALLRSLFGSFNDGDVAVMDRYYCSFMMIAMFTLQRTHVCARLHHLRPADFRKGRRLGKCDRIVEWIRPRRPAWMGETTYRTIPESMQLRLIKFQIEEPGRRTASMTVVTTLLDADEYSKADIAQLYGFRWNIELDIRSIKRNLNLDHMRCKTPKMIRVEFRTTLLAYNLIRSVSSTAALLHDKRPRQISFVSTCQYVMSSWISLSLDQVPTHRVKAYCRAILKQIASCEVANRPGRIEPRVVKRRPNSHKLMKKPRHVLRAEIRKTCT